MKKQNKSSSQSSSSSNKKPKFMSKEQLNQIKFNISDDENEDDVVDIIDHDQEEEDLFIENKQDKNKNISFKLATDFDEIKEITDPKKEKKKNGRFNTVLREDGIYSKSEKEIITEADYENEFGYRYGNEWMSEYEEKLRVLEQNKNYKFLTLLSGATNTQIYNLIDEENLTSVVRANRLIQQQKSQIENQKSIDVTKINEELNSIQIKLDHLELKIEDSKWITYANGQQRTKSIDSLKNDIINFQEEWINALKNYFLPIFIKECVYLKDGKFYGPFVNNIYKTFLKIIANISNHDSLKIDLEESKNLVNKEKKIVVLSAKIINDELDDFSKAKSVDDYIQKVDQTEFDYFKNFLLNFDENQFNFERIDELYEILIDYFNITRNQNEDLEKDQDFFEAETFVFKLTVYNNIKENKIFLMNEEDFINNKTGIKNITDKNGKKIKKYHLSHNENDKENRPKLPPKIDGNLLEVISHNAVNLLLGYQKNVDTLQGEKENLLTYKKRLETKKQNLFLGIVDFPPQKDIPYEHRLAWLNRPENSGIIRIKPVVVASISKAMDDILQHIPWAKRINENDYELFQHDPTIQSTFASLVAVQMSLLSLTFPKANLSDSLKKWTKIDHVNVIDRLKNRFRPQFNPKGRLTSFKRIFSGESSKDNLTSSQKRYFKDLNCDDLIF